MTYLIIWQNIPPRPAITLTYLLFQKDTPDLDLDIMLVLNRPVCKLRMVDETRYFGKTLHGRQKSYQDKLGKIISARWKSMGL